MKKETRIASNVTVNRQSRLTLNASCGSFGVVNAFWEVIPTTARRKSPIERILNELRTMLRGVIDHDQCQCANDNCHSTGTTNENKRVLIFEFRLKWCLQ